MAKPIKVRAVLKGQKPNRKWAAIGDEFEIDPKFFSERWMVKVEASKPAPAPKAEDK